MIWVFITEMKEDAYMLSYHKFSNTPSEDPSVEFKHKNAAF